MTDTGSTAPTRPGSLAATLCAWVLVISLGAAGTAALPGPQPGPGPGPVTPQEAHAKTDDTAPHDKAGNKTSHGAEPSTWLLLAAGLAALLLLHQRRRPRTQMAEPAGVTRARTST